MKEKKLKFKKLKFSKKCIELLDSVFVNREKKGNLKCLK